MLVKGLNDAGFRTLLKVTVTVPCDEGQSVVVNPVKYTIFGGEVAVTVIVHPLVNEPV
jgi:hypothetical protein